MTVMANNNKGPAMGCAILLVMAAGALFVLWLCARTVACAFGF